MFIHPCSRSDPNSTVLDYCDQKVLSLCLKLQELVLSASCLLRGSGQAGWSEACRYMLGIVQYVNMTCKHQSLPHLLTLGLSSLTLATGEGLKNTPLTSYLG